MIDDLYACEAHSIHLSRLRGNDQAGHQAFLALK
jgi:hypothetical protein